jgi:hypothetical protein
MRQIERKVDVNQITTIRRRREIMSLSDPILTAPGAGRTVDYGHGSSAEG